MTAQAIPRPKKGQCLRKRTPTVIQMEAAECGAAALCSILGYFGSFPPLEQVRIMCSVSRDGSNALKIITAAEYYGLKAEGFSAELQDLYSAPLPVIAFWNFDHFIIIEGFDTKKVYINDPASGPRAISYEEFNESFTGVILTFCPTETFKKIAIDKERRWTTLLWDRFKDFKAPLVFTLLIGFFSIFPTLGLTMLSQIFIDKILIGKTSSWTTGLLLGFALFSTLSTVIYLLEHWILARFNVKLLTYLSTHFVWHTLRLPILFFMQRFGGEIASRIELNEDIAQSWISELLPTVIDVLFAFIFAALMFYYDPQIASIGVGLVLATLILMKVLYRSREDAYANYRQIQGKIASFTINGLESIESLKAVGGEYHFIGRYGGIYTKALNTTQSIAYSDLILGTVSPLLSSIGSLSVLILGAYKIIQGMMTVGEFIALQMLFHHFTEPALNLVNLNQTLQLLKINLLRLDDVMRHPQDPLLNHHPVLSDFPSNLNGKIEITDLQFSYGPLDAPLLDNINLTITSGTTVAVVGETGCGKSTLIKIIGGLLNPKKGDIRFDGVSYACFPREVLTRSIGVVQQSPYLFEDTIQNNLSLMDLQCNPNEMIQAAKDACIHEEIMGRPGGYQAKLDRDGANFSGGQRQRLEIACALNRNPSIIIFDEATSAVDSLTERQILENVRKRGKTCLIITHRLKTIQDCDMIVVMDKGKIIQQGTHRELISQGGLYQSLVDSAERLDFQEIEV